MTVPAMVEIPDDEIEFRASRAGGPGGQNVNRRATRVEARWNVLESSSISDEQRKRILTRLANRIGKDGVMRVVAEEERSQGLNREIAAARLRQLVAKSLERRKPRKTTKPPRSAVEGRLREKQRRKKTKEKRKRPTPED